MSHTPEQSMGFDARHLHIAAFAKQGATLQGTQGLKDFPRVLEECNADNNNTAAHWQAQGKVVSDCSNGPTQIWLDLRIDTTLTMQCQRCLQAMSLPIHIERSFRFVRDEATAARLDEELEDDVLVCSKQFDLFSLIEDELLMALPISPRHGVCTEQTAQYSADHNPAQESPEQEHPFAALQLLKKQPH